MKSLKGRVFCFSTKDRIHLSKYNVQAQVIDFYLDERISLQMTFSPLQFSFLANWERRENLQGLLWFLERVYPRLPKKFIFMVIGRMTDVKMMRFGAGLPNVRFLGFVDNPYEILSSGSCLIAPLFSGAGVKVKVVEALACGVPVIGTRIAFEGIEWVNQRFMIPAENEDEFVTNICETNFTINDRMKLYKDFHESYGKKLLGTVLSEKG
jgi:glycosyltransferase involved in cell wall biosynthesis